MVILLAVCLSRVVVVWWQHKTHEVVINSVVCLLISPQPINERHVSQ